MGVLFLLRCFCFAASDYGESVQLDMAHAMFCLERRPTTNGRYNKRQRRGSQLCKWYLATSRSSRV